jgi:hypothetical protein
MEKQEWEWWQVLGLLILFAATACLLFECVLHPYSKTAHAVTGKVFGLIGLLILILILPRIRTISAEALGGKAQIGLAGSKEAAEAEQHAQQAVAADPALVVPPAAADPLAEANPGSSIENSRRKLASELAALSAARGVTFTGDIASSAAELKKKGVIDDPTEKAVTLLAQSFAESRLNLRPAPALAFQIDSATQLIAARLTEERSMPGADEAAAAAAPAEAG